MDAYLDIETTGLSPQFSRVTVVGVALGNGEDVVQLVGGEISASRLMDVLGSCSNLYTYNGARFDLPFLAHHLGVDLCRHFAHRDLMHDCWSRKLYGGFKAVERSLGIPRKLKEVNGLEAVRLWRRYERHGDQDALRQLLAYNCEDVLNLRTLKQLLNIS